MLVIFAVVVVIFSFFRRVGVFSAGFFGRYERPFRSLGRGVGTGLLGVFILLFVFNISGLVPYGFSVTSQG